jgi:hypothetical protein
MPTTDHLAMTKHLFISSSCVLYFEWFKMLWEGYLKALEIIFEVQRKRNNEKITRRKISFSTSKMFFFFFSFLLFELVYKTWPFIICTHNAPDVTHTLVKFEPYSYAQMLHQGEVSSLWSKPINCSECFQTI